jgi:hypothetical protein
MSVVWDWDIGNGNAILLEADAGGIRVIDHMDHLVDVRQDRARTASQKKLSTCGCGAGERKDGAG